MQKAMWLPRSPAQRSSAPRLSDGLEELSCRDDRDVPILLQSEEVRIAADDVLRPPFERGFHVLVVFGICGHCGDGHAWGNEVPNDTESRDPLPDLIVCCVDPFPHARAEERSADFLCYLRGEYQNEGLMLDE